MAWSRSETGRTPWKGAAAVGCEACSEHSSAGRCECCRRGTLNWPPKAPCSHVWCLPMLFLACRYISQNNRIVGGVLIHQRRLKKKQCKNFGHLMDTGSSTGREASMQIPPLRGADEGAAFLRAESLHAALPCVMSSAWLPLLRPSTTDPRAVSHE